MKNFRRPHPELSLCGLNCPLCPMYIGTWCPGCGGGAGNQPCRIARCGQTHGGVEYCYQCEEYPCPRLEEAMVFDSFLSHRHMRKDLDRAKALGPEVYRAELAEKAAILRRLLERYNDGRRKGLFCAATALLDLGDLRCALREIESKDAPELTGKERAALAARCLETLAAERGSSLKLRKRPKT